MRVSPNIRELRVGEGTLFESNHFERIFAAVRHYIDKKKGVGLDNAVKYVRETEHTADTPGAKKNQKLLVFAILGWQSMLYRPSFNTCDKDVLAIHEDYDECNSGLVYDRYTVHAENSDRPLSAMTKGFGNLLPAPYASCVDSAYRKIQTASAWQPLDPSQINAHILSSFLHIKFHWVDTIALHLDFNRSTRTLSLFRFPSMCIAQLASEGSLYAFASLENPKCFNPRAGYEDLSQYLREILLSYRLLFGQHPASQQRFRDLYKVSRGDDIHDVLLWVLCLSKKVRDEDAVRHMSPDLPVYFAAQHFPILKDRIELIASELKNYKPGSLTEIMMDRRDITRFGMVRFGFVFGVVTVLLNFVQVVLLGVQLRR